MLPSIARADELDYKKPRPAPKALSDRLLEWVSGGRKPSEWSEQEGTATWSTVTNWLTRDPEFRTRYYAARAAGAEKLIDEVLTIADDVSADIHEGRPNPVAVARAKLRIDTRLQVLRALAPHLSREADAKLQAGSAQLIVITGVPAAPGLVAKADSKLQVTMGPPEDPIGELEDPDAEIAEILS